VPKRKENEMIRVENLYHTYQKGNKNAVDGISFEVKRGEIFGFLGPSGAGKSTTQNILLGLIEKQKGKVELDGNTILKTPPKELFNRIGVSFEQSNVYGKLTGLENLEFYRKLFDVETEDPKHLLEWVGLSEHMNKRADEYSKGMKHRLTFARSMLNRPKLWFLDEPTSGLDPATAEQMIRLIRRRNDEGATIFITTHNMHVAESLCDRVAFINDGKIQLIDSPRILKLQYGEKRMELEYKEKGKLRKENLSFVDEKGRMRIKEIMDTKEVEMMHTKEATLDDIFVRVTGRSLD